MSSALKLFEPAIISDADNGGGPMVRVEIPPGVDGNLFDKISSLALSRGQVSIRELFVALDTANDALVSNAHLIIREEPADPLVSVILFALDGLDWAYRSQAAAHIEAYTQQGLELDWRIRGDHPEGLRTLRLWGTPASRLPGVGDVIVVTDGAFEQYLRVESASADVSSWGAGDAAFDYLGALIEISAPLNQVLSGTNPDKTLPNVTQKVRAGQVAPSARYYGVTHLAADVAVGDVDIPVGSIYAAIVPAAQSEQAITDSPILPRVIRSVSAGGGNTYTDPAAPAHTDSRAITSANRGLVYVLTLTPLPVAGTITFEFRTLGRWYTLSDNGDGTIGGTGAGGIGNYDPATGSVSITLEFLPDIDTHQVWSWGSDQQWLPIPPAATDPARVVGNLGAGVTPSGLQLTWQEGGVGKTATDNGTGGITGDASGSIIYSTGDLVLIPGSLPDGPIGWDGQTGEATATGTETAPTISGGRVTWTRADLLPITPGSVLVRMDVQYQWPDGSATPHGGGTVTHTWVDNGAGQLTPLPGLFAGYNITIDYTTGAFDAPESIPNFSTAIRWLNGDFVSQSVSSKYLAGNAITVESSGAGGTPVATAGTLSGYPLTIPMPPGDPIQIESVVLDIAGVEYSGNNLTLAGDDIELTGWQGGAANAPALVSGLRRGQEWDVQTIHWRTAGAPIRAASIIARADASSGGAEQVATTDNGGAFLGDATGTADYESGYMLTVWNVAIDPNTATHNGVIVKLVPQDADKVGLDGTRLPPDGRVPVFLPGYQVVIHDHAPETLPNNLTAGQAVTLQQAGLSTVELADQNGLAVDDSHYTLDTRTGVLTMATPLDLSAFAEPLAAEVYWDDTHPVNSVQATGVVTLSSPLKRAYSSATARLSSVLELGDLQSHVPIIFDQKVWNGEYLDAVNGDPAAGTYNHAAYPVETTNNGAEAERWVIHWLDTNNGANLVEIIGERVGNLGQFDFNADLSPINPQSGVPWFILRAAGRGAGWIPGNILRINTKPGAAHAVAVRCVGMGAQDLEHDQTTLQPRGPEVV